MIIFEKVYKSFGEKSVIEDLSLSVGEGERVALVGESGSGKTTLVRLICGLEKPDKGKISGYSFSDVSVMFQEPRLFPWLSALENVTLERKGRDPAAEEKARALLSELGVAESEDMLPRELSGGMQRRVAIARLIASNRKIVLLDEAFESLDEKTREISREVIKKHCKGKTLILVSHNADDVSSLTDRRITVNKI